MESVETYTNTNVSLAFESIIRRNLEKVGKDFAISYSEDDKRQFTRQLLKLRLRKQERLIRELSEQLKQKVEKHP
jgi:hypothetical protein